LGTEGYQDQEGKRREVFKKKKKKKSGKVRGWVKWKGGVG
jgi:hypothetical protein